MSTTFKTYLLHGRYTKLKRELPQKQKPCINCAGKGCRICNFHGITEYDSVEGRISEIHFDKFGGTTAKFTWIGGEDKSSLVLGSQWKLGAGCAGGAAEP